MDFESSASGDLGSGSGLGANPEEDESTSLWIVVLQIVFCAIGLLGNVAVMFVMLALKEYMKSVTNWYVLQLAIADTMFLCTIPAKVKETLDGKWPGTASLCKVNEAMIYLNYYSSILMLTVMSIDRYLIVCHNMSAISQKLRKRSSAYLITVIVWAISLILCTPIFMYANVTNCRCRYEFRKHATPEDECRSIGMGDSIPLCLQIMQHRAKSVTCEDGDNGLPDFNSSVIDDLLDMDGPISNVAGDSNSYGVYSFDGSYEAGGPNINASDFSSNYGTNDYATMTGTLFPQILPYNGTGVSTNRTTRTSEPDETSNNLPYECTYEEESAAWIAFVRFNFIALFVLPFIIMFVCYSFIAKMMLRSGSRKTSLSDAKSTKERRKLTKSEKTYRKTTQLCVAFVVLFAVCWLPFHSVHLSKITGIHQSKNFCIDITAVTMILVIANSAINPYLYNIVGKKFSRRLRTAASSMKGRMASQADTSTSTSGFAVRYRRGKKHKFRFSSGSNTGTTRIYKGKSEVESSEKASGEGPHESSAGP